MRPVGLLDDGGVAIGFVEAFASVARGENERNALLAQAVGHRIAARRAKIHVKDGKLDAMAGGKGQRLVEMHGEQDLAAGIKQDVLCKRRHQAFVLDEQHAVAGKRIQIWRQCQATDLKAASKAAWSLRFAGGRCKSIVQTRPLGR